jgi:exodeoxyribonuclease V alpha subunit
VGKVVRIDRKAKKVAIKVYGDPNMIVDVEFKNVGSLLRLAYACTVHKSQGLEYDIIVMPVVESFRHQLQRNLLYTAVTRAKKKVYLVGSMAALGMAVVNDSEDQRNTLFKDRLMGWK